MVELEDRSRGNNLVVFGIKGSKNETESELRIKVARTH